MVRTAGDVVVWARPVGPETFAPYGRLLGVGDRLPLGRAGGTLVSLDEVRLGPRRFTHLSCYPDAQRLLLPVADAAFFVLVLSGGADGGASGPPVAFSTGSGQGLLIDAGVWHAGPVALREGALLEILETRGAVDRLDRRALSALLGVEAVRVGLPEEPGAPARPLDLHGPGAVIVEPGIGDVLTLGLLLFDDLDVVPDHPGLAEEIDRVCAAFCEIGATSHDRSSLFGVEAVRALWRALGLDPADRPTPYEECVRAVLAREPLRVRDSLSGALQLTALRRQVVLAGHDAAALSAPLQLRRGRATEALTDGQGRSISVPALPVLCDRDGPFGGPVGSVRRASLGSGTRSALVALYLPAAAEASAVEAHLEETSRTVRSWCGGVETSRLAIRGSGGSGD